MYSFSRRPDTKVIDEPFYAHYLETTGTDHPGREDTLRSMSTDINKVLDDIFNRNECEVLFLKNMAHHHQQMDLSFLDKMTNLFLVRNPKQLIASFAQVITSPNMKDIGLKKSWELFNKIENQNPVVLDSAEILKNPKSLLSKLCDNLEINFFEEMLSWPSGGIPEDGPWAKYWYKNVHSSSGFAKQKTSSRELPKNCESLYLEALKYYNKLKVNSISA
jgi:hypothetical protein